MAASAKYPTAHEQLGDLARAARLDLVPFEEWWERALRPGQAPITPRVPERERPGGCIVWPTDTNDRRTSLAAINGTKEAWRRSYEASPPLRREHRLTELRG